jgi:acyl-coenzyme A thioesterase PaaI-like protein
VVAQTRRTALCEADLLNQDGELVARAQATAFKHDTPLLPRD